MTNRTQTPTLEDALPEIERRLDACSSEAVNWSPFSRGKRAFASYIFDASMLARLRDLGTLQNPDTAKRNTYLILNVKDPVTSKDYPMPASRAIAALIMYDAGFNMAKGWRVGFKDGNPRNLRCSNLRVERVVRQRNLIKALWIMSRLLKAQAQGANDNEPLDQQDAAA